MTVAAAASAWLRRLLFAVMTSAAIQPAHYTAALYWDEGIASLAESQVQDFNGRT